MFTMNLFGFMKKGLNSKGRRKIRPNGIKPSYQRADLNIRAKIRIGRIIWLNGERASSGPSLCYDLL